MSRHRRVLACGLGCLLLSACAEMIRRPESSVPEARSVPQASEPSQRLAARSSAGRDSRAQILRQVNEYAWWCVDQGLWNEARTHLERALAQDSLSASLHNNLAIVYEHLGRHDEAARYYQKAHELNPGQAVYTANLKRLEQLREAGADTTGRLDLLDFRDRTPGPQREPRVTGD